MTGGGEQRRHVRLPGRGGSAREFSGDRAGPLPDFALVADVSEGGVGLCFSWPDDGEFPLRKHDGLAFRLRLDPGDRTFDLMSVVRHVAHAAGSGEVRVGVEFSGLEQAVREEIKNAVVNLAVTALRKWSAGPGPGKAARSPEKAAGLPRSATRRRRLYLGEILVQQGALAADRLDRFISTEFSGQRLLGEELTARGLVGEAALARALAEQAGLRFLDLEAQPSDMALVSRLPRKVFMENWCLPVCEEQGALLVAMSSPPDLDGLGRMREELGRRLRVGIAPAGQLAGLLKRVYNLEGAPRPMAISFAVQLHAEYRLLTPDWKRAVDSRPCTGLTTEISHRGMMVAGPLPEGFSPERISAEKLKMAVRVSSPDLAGPMAMGCTPKSVRKSKYAGEHLLEARIDRFPKGGEAAWSRLCLLRGTRRFRPGQMR
jgi:hypothetical protein